MTDLTVDANGLNLSYSAYIFYPGALAYCNSLLFTYYTVYVDGEEYGTYQVDDQSGAFSVSGDIILDSYGEHTISITAKLDGITTNTLTTNIFLSENERPNNFEWDAAKKSGETFSLTKEEMNRLMDNINATRVYRGLQAYPFAKIQSGDTFTSDIYNNIVEAIQGISGYGDYLKNVTANSDVISARDLNVLKDEINAVI